MTFISLKNCSEFHTKIWTTLSVYIRVMYVVLLYMSVNSDFCRTITHHANIECARLVGRTFEITLALVIQGSHKERAPHKCYATCNIRYKTKILLTQISVFIWYYQYSPCEANDLYAAIWNIIILFWNILLSTEAYISRNHFGFAAYMERIAKKRPN